jgi:hypothetical protein
MRMNAKAEARIVAKFLLDGDDMLSQQADPQAVARELGLTFDGEQDWTLKKLWSFTMRDTENPMAGVTFYTQVGASRDEIIAAWQRKLAEFKGETGLQAAR